MRRSLWNNCEDLSLPLLEYLRSVCQIQYDMETDESGMDARYFLIGEKDSSRLDKQPVRPGRALPPEEYKNITINLFVGLRIRFDRLRSAS